MDIRNPHALEESLSDPDELLEDYQALLAEPAETRDALKRELMAALEPGASKMEERGKEVTL